MNLPKTPTRVPEHSADRVNRQIRTETADRIQYYSEHLDEIGSRLEELDQEWDIERTLEANAATLILLTLGTGVTVNRKFLVVPAIVAGFLLQHALQGWCPPVTLFRRLGIRTQREIEFERQALIALQDSA